MGHIYAEALIFPGGVRKVGCLHARGDFFHGHAFFRRRHTGIAAINKDLNLEKWPVCNQRVLRPGLTATEPAFDGAGQAWLQLTEQRPSIKRHLA